NQRVRLPDQRPATAAEQPERPAHRLGEPVGPPAVAQPRPGQCRGQEPDACSTDRHRAVMNLDSSVQAIKRVRHWYGLLLFVLIIFCVRLFDVQVINYNHYRNAALGDHLKQYQIPASRGIIEAHEGDTLLPLVSNQKLYLLYADPTYIKNPDKLAGQLAPIIGGSADQYAKMMRTKDSRYVVLAKQLSKRQNGAVLALKSPGLGLQALDYRTYPQGSLAAQTLG